MRNASVGVRAMYALAVAAQISCHAAHSPGASVVRGTRLPADGGVRGRDVLGSDEIKKISSSNAANAYEVVKRLRPEFLTQRTLSVTGDRVLGPALRINEGSVPDIDVLRTIPARDLIEVRFVRPLDAVHRFGAMFGAGLLLVRTAP